MSTGEENVEMIHPRGRRGESLVRLKRGRQWMVVETPFLISFTTSVTWYFFYRVKAAET